MQILHNWATLLVPFVIFFYFETDSHYIAQADLKLAMQPSMALDFPSSYIRLQVTGITVATIMTSPMHQAGGLVVSNFFPGFPNVLYHKETHKRLLCTPMARLLKGFPGSGRILFLIQFYFIF